MAFSASDSDVDYLSEGTDTAIKVVVVGRFGVGKTTFVQAVSEIRMLATEETMTEASTGVDTLVRNTEKMTTTVALDFGRISISEEIVLYLFGAPGQQRFQPVLNSLLPGALGGIALVDTLDLAGSFDGIDRLEEAGLRYAVAVNHFDGEPRYSDEQLREALNLAEDTPLIVIDARSRESAKQALIALVHHLIAHHAVPEPTS